MGVPRQGMTSDALDHQCDARWEVDILRAEVMSEPGAG
jgi:hypothetical protein